jgi:hypothetical protein
MLALHFLLNHDYFKGRKINQALWRTHISKASTLEAEAGG